MSLNRWPHSSPSPSLSNPHTTFSPHSHRQTNASSPPSSSHFSSTNPPSVVSLSLNPSPSQYQHDHYNSSPSKGSSYYYPDSTPSICTNSHGAQNSNPNLSNFQSNSTSHITSSDFFSSSNSHPQDHHQNTHIHSNDNSNDTSQKTNSIYPTLSMLRRTPLAQHLYSEESIRLQEHSRQTSFIGNPSNATNGPSNIQQQQQHSSSLQPGSNSVSNPPGIPLSPISQQHQQHSDVYQSGYGNDQTNPNSLIQAPPSISIRSHLAIQSFRSASSPNLPDFALSEDSTVFSRPISPPPRALSTSTSPITSHRKNSSDSFGDSAQKPGKPLNKKKKKNVSDLPQAPPPSSVLSTPVADGNVQVAAYIPTDRFPNALFQGWMKKRKKGNESTTKSRYLVVNTNCLEYYSDPFNAAPKGVIYFDDIGVHFDETLTVIAHGKVWEFIAESERDLTRWHVVWRAVLSAINK